MVHVFVACRTAKLLKVIRDYFRSAQRLVTFNTRDRHVTSVQAKTGLLVRRKRVAGCLERCSVMALLAAIVPRSARELPCVFVLMTIDAQRELDFEASILSGRNMARGALYFVVR